MTLLYIDDSLPHDKLFNLVSKVCTMVNDEVLVLPKSFNLMLNASTEQLIAAKNAIDAALKLRENN